MVNNNEISPFAVTSFRGHEKVFGIKDDDRRRHMYLIGKTGMGKSNTIEHMAIYDIQHNRGVAVVDPHGESVEKIIKFVPKSRINDVVYFNPADLNYPIAFNVLEKVSPEYRHLVSSGLLGVFKKIWADSWGPRLEYVLNNAIMALLEYPGSTLLGIMRILTDKIFRKKVISKITDPVVKSFWINEFSKYPDRFQAEAIAPIQNKVGRFLSSSMMRNIVGQIKSSIDLRSIMDDKKIFLLNLSKGRIGEDNSALLGAMIITKLQLAAMSRVDIPEEQRNDFYLYVDEFQNFATESFVNILSEARKYRLNLILAHQYILQLDEKVAAGIFGNIGTICSFRVGAEDAEFLEKEFEPRFMQNDLVNLPKFHMYLKLMIDGISSEPFSAKGIAPLPIPGESQEVVDKIIKITRERYTTKKDIIEDKISRWSGVMDVEEEDKEKKVDRSWPKERSNLDANINSPSSSQSPKVQAICDNCGAETVLNFEPDPRKPIYCKKCLKDIKEKRINSSRPAARPNSNIPRKEISLAEAFKKQPVDFKNRSRPSPGGAG
ncbi:DUF87 domain-containing protein [Patescibacteria group bacterium]|nr:DUF87 domain-containing protein [Patescibacteria group bacterium]